jgi:hypothetical protein
LTYRFLESYMTTVFKLLVALFTLAFTLLGFAVKALLFFLEMLGDSVGTRDEVFGDSDATHTYDGRVIID